jgi:cell division inhibitor SepF
MAGAMRKMAVYLGLVEDASYEDYDEYDDYEEPARESRRDRNSRRSSRDRYEADDDAYEVRSVRPINEPRSVRTIRPDSAADRAPSSAAVGRPAMADLSRIEAIHPRSYNDARRIGEEFRDGVPVIIDFAAGLVYGLHGTIERITGKVFLLSPANVDLGDQARAQIAEDGFFNQS